MGRSSVICAKSVLNIYVCIVSIERGGGGGGGAMLSDLYGTSLYVHVATCILDRVS